jgi:hypothetical protein
MLTVRGQGEDRQRSDAQQSEHHRGKLDDVGQLEDDPVAPRQTEAAQPGGHPVGGGVEPGIGHRPLAAAHRDPVTAGVGPAAQQVPEPLAPPVAGLAVALGELGRERYAARKHHDSAARALSWSRWPALWPMT